MKMVNGTLCVLAASSPSFWQKVATIENSDEKFCEFLRSYGTSLLTMIKIVLIATISFAPLSQ
jgi:hypothetical protein